jgi:arabinogalactan endo-1,4-beta-galactosidase
MKKILAVLIFVFASCSTSINEKEEADLVIRAADISSLPTIETTSTTFYHNNKAENVITTLANAGCNYARLRVWFAPENNASSLAEVKVLSERVRKSGMKVWITVHYSDTWADPGHQEKPAAWSSMNFAQLKTAVYNYTTLLMNELKPEIIQIGNETNDGMLWPEGKISTNEMQYLALTQTAVDAIRTTSTKTKIMLHFAGISGADYYFNKVKSIDYDYIGISYYPLWHGKNLSHLENTLNQLATTYEKKVVIAETAYPFTLGYNDYTNNIVGQENQLIPGFAATAEGQHAFLMALKSMTDRSTSIIGYCYWEPQFVAFRGPTSNQGSPWENQALWNFENKSLPALEFFSE